MHTVTKEQNKARLTAAAADLIRRRGLHATSVRELAKHAGAPLGSVYHYYPDGKQQFVSEAIALAGCKIAQQLETCLADGPQAGFRAYFADWRQLLTETDYSAGCPLAAISLDANARHDVPAALLQTAEVFSRLQTQIADSLQAHGAQLEPAQALAMAIISTIEGAILVCRAQRQLTALDAAEEMVMRLLQSVLPSAAL